MVSADGRPCEMGHGVMRRGWRVYWVDGRRPFVLQIRGGIRRPLWLPACTPAIELREGISAPQSFIVLSGVLSSSFILSVSAALFWRQCTVSPDQKNNLQAAEGY